LPAKLQKVCCQHKG